MVATLVIGIACVGLLGAAVEGKAVCATGTCPVGKDVSMLQRAALHQRGSLQRDRRVSADRSLDHSAAATTASAYAAYTASAAYTAKMWSMVYESHALRDPATTELEKVIENNAEHNAERVAKCAPALKDAKDQLQKLHDTVNDVAEEVNSTQAGLKAQQFSLASTQDEENEIKEWKDKQKHKCDKEREDRKKTLDVLKADLSDLKKLAIQSNATIPGSNSEAALLEESVGGLKPESDVRALVLVAKSAAAALAKCVNKAHSGSKPGTSLIEAPEGTPTPDECQEAKKELEDSVNKPLKELTREVANNEDLVDSPECEDTVKEEFKSKITPIQKEAEKFATKLEDDTKTLSELKPRLEKSQDVEKELQDKVKKLAKSCDQLPETQKDLDKIKDVIKVMLKCPGLDKAKINVPTWVGSWVKIEQKADQTDEALDDKMNEACTGIKGAPARAAEIGEIIAGTIINMPSTNTADATVLGAGPFSEGYPDSETGMTHLSHHARVGWDVGKPFTKQTERKDCSVGSFAVLCVIDTSLSPSIDPPPAEQLTLPPPAPNQGDAGENEGNQGNTDNENDANADE
jgi:septal ring factor EnvC (AmiA/AmiB activator)